MAAGAPGVADRRRRVVDLPWTWLHQVHGADVVVVDEPGAMAGADADAAVTTVRGAALAVAVADCAPVVLRGTAPGVRGAGCVGVAHAGWRSLLAGVLPATVERMRSLRAGDEVSAHVGPCIHAGCYAFGEAELDLVADRLGAGVRGRTALGEPALDVVAAVRASLAEAGVDDVVVARTCTACSSRHWSHRARGDTARQVAVAWLS